MEPALDPDGNSSGAAADKYDASKISL